MKNTDKSGEWIDQSLIEVIEIDPVNDLKGYNNPETLRQALGRLFWRDMRRKIKENTIHVTSLIFAGVYSKILTGPLERIKILQQTEQVWKAGIDPNLTQRSFLGLAKGTPKLNQRSKKFRVGEPYGEAQLQTLSKQCQIVSSTGW
jgi:hypothetical protein